MRQVCEKHRAKWKVVLWTFKDLKKAYDKIDRRIWQMLELEENC